jgi:hypothetical protein
MDRPEKPDGRAKDGIRPNGLFLAGAVLVLDVPRDRAHAGGQALARERDAIANRAAGQPMTGAEFRQCPDLGHDGCRRVACGPRHVPRNRRGQSAVHEEGNDNDPKCGTQNKEHAYTRTSQGRNTPAPSFIVLRCESVARRRNQIWFQLPDATTLLQQSDRLLIASTDKQ